ncbi:hypothetical protein ABPG73_008930 [Tetrahymena malaccensis]
MSKPIGNMPNQQENTDESEFIFDQEFNSGQIGQNNIFDNIIAINKFDECLVSDYSFYNPATGSCTTNCPNSSNQSSRSCSSIKQFSQIRTLASRNKAIQEDIEYVYYFDQIKGKQMVIQYCLQSNQIKLIKQVVTVNNVEAVLYSYPELIPMNYLALLNSFKAVTNDSQNLFLISTSNVQKIDLVDFQPYSLNAPGSTNDNGSSPDDPQPPEQDSNQPQIETILDSQGCLMINSTIQQTPTLQNINIAKRDFLKESKITQQKIVNIFQVANSTSYFDNLDNSFTSYIDQENNQINLYYLNLNLQIQSLKDSLKKIQVLHVYQYDGKTRIIVIQTKNYNGILQSAVVCANLTQNTTSMQYYFEYDKPHFAQLTSQIIEYIITDDKNFLIIATSQGYEKINISPQMSMVTTNSSQNWSFLFSSIIDNNLLSHSKFLSNNELLYYNITNNSIQLQLLNFGNQGFQSSNNNSISLNSTSYPNFNINFNQVQKVNNKSLIISYKNQLQTISLPDPNSNQTIYYSSFIELDAAYYLQGIFKIIYSDQLNMLAIVFQSGFRIIKVNGQKLIYEKNLMQQIVQAEIVSQYLVLVYINNNNNYNFAAVNILSLQIYQYDIQSGSTYISLIKQQNPQRIFLGIYYILPDSQSQLGYYGVVQSINTILVYITVSSILAITSNSELVIYDFIINQQVKYLFSSFNCFLYSNYTSDIYCLEYNNVLKKFNYTALDFIIVTDQTVIQIQVTEFVALSKSVLAFISPQGNMILLNPNTLQVSPIISIQQYIDKIVQIEQYIIVQSQQKYLQVFQLQSQSNTLNAVSNFQFNMTGYKVLDFTVISFSNNKTLVIAGSLSIYNYNMQNNQFIGNIPTSCQDSLKFKCAALV